MNKKLFGTELADARPISDLPHSANFGSSVSVEPKQLGVNVLVLNRGVTTDVPARI